MDEVVVFGASRKQVTNPAAEDFRTRIQRCAIAIRLSMIRGLLFLMVACGRSPESIAIPPAPPAQAVLELPTPLSSGVISASFYQQIRSNPTLGSALDEAMIPALEVAGPPQQRLAAFHQARQEALDALTTDTTPGPPPTADQIAMGPIGPMGDPLQLAFDRVCTDVLRLWFRTHAKAISAANSPQEQRVKALNTLATLAAESFSWDPSAATSTKVEVNLVRAVLEEG